MFAFALAVGIGQLLAVAVHGVTWWLRKRALWLLLAMGMGGLLILTVASSSLKIVVMSILFALVLGWCQSFQVERVLQDFSCSRSQMWLSASLAFWAEIGFAFGMCILTFELLSTSYVPKWRFGGYGHLPYMSWYFLSVFLTLALLALFRPFFLKLWRAIYQTIKPATSEAQRL